MATTTLLPPNASQAELIAALGQLQSSIGTAQETTVASLNEFYALWAGVLVLSMQIGFAMLEAGSVHSKNVINIFFKNIMDASIAVLAFWLLGYGFAYGTDNGDGFIGTDDFALSAQPTRDGGYHSFFFQYAFAATAATIVSGCVAERCKISVYFIYTFLITVFIYPVVVHWGWSDGGWLSPFNSDGSTVIGSKNGMVDFAGSGIVHMVGGFAGLAGSIALGPRIGRFDEKTRKPLPMRNYNAHLQVLGTFFLWVGWYGFNSGSTLCMDGCTDLASKVAVNTTIAAGTGFIFGSIFSRITLGHFDLGKGCNSLLGALVSITAGCAVVEPWAAFVIGIIGAIIYFIFSFLVLLSRTDDPVDAFAVHGACGFWGVLAAGLFFTDANLLAAGYRSGAPTGEQFVVQLIGALSIAAWTMGMSFPLFYGLKYTMGIRVPRDTELKGLDMVEHGSDFQLWFTFDAGDGTSTAVQSDNGSPGSDHENDEGGAEPVLTNEKDDEMEKGKAGSQNKGWGLFKGSGN